MKRPRPTQPLPPVQDDDIQEVVPVKTEPAIAAVTSYSGAGASQEQQVAAYEDENYAEYGEYEDQQGYTDTGMVDFNQSMDGNKGKTNMQILSLKLRHFLKTELCFISDLFGMLCFKFECYACLLGICNFSICRSVQTNACQLHWEISIWERRDEVPMHNVWLQF